MEQSAFDDANKDEYKPTYCDQLADDLYIAQFLKLGDLDLSYSQEINQDLIVNDI